jgi:hypothetical protein
MGVSVKRGEDAVVIVQTRRYRAIGPHSESTRRGLVDKLTARSLLSHRKYGKENCELHSRCITKRYSGPSGSHLLETLGVDLSLHQPVHRQIFFAALKRACNSAFIAPRFQFPELTCRELIGYSIRP